MAAIGRHCILELYDCPPQRLDDQAFVRTALHQAVEAGFATLLDDVSQRFSPHGVTALALIAESHVAIHTWPEHRYVAADVFTCGDVACARKACEQLIRSFEPRRHALMELARGLESGAAAGDAIARPQAPAAGVHSPMGSKRR